MKSVPDPKIHTGDGQKVGIPPMIETKKVLVDFSLLRRKPITTDALFRPFFVVISNVSNPCNCLFLVPTGSPQNFTAIGVSSTSIRLQWDPPPRKHRNGEVVLYEVLYHQQRPSTVDWTTNTTDNFVMVEGLETSTDYNFMIRAYTAIGPGPWSNRLPFRTFPHCKYSLSYENLAVKLRRVYSSL